MASVSDSIPVTVISDEEKTVIETEQGTVLRDLLLEHGFSVYPRLSCCVTVTEPMQVQLLEKHVWGQLLPRMGNDRTTRAGED